MSKNDLTAQRLRELLDYDPNTGVFTRLLAVGRWDRNKPGSTVGGSANKQRCILWVDRHLYKTHRLAWLHYYGTWPCNQIDHIDGDPSNNRIRNLREATNITNAQNVRKARRHNKSGFLGVTKNKKRWSARIVVNERMQFLGNYDTPELAHAAYIEAKRRLHPGCTI